MIQLTPLCQGVVNLPEGVDDTQFIREIAIDSRKVQPGDLFVAIRGFETDGHQYIEQAIEKGARFILVEDKDVVASVPVLHSDNTRKAVSILASRFYGNPSNELNLIGITGTNGKSTITFLLESILAHAGINVGLMGTLMYRWKGSQDSASHTTPDSLALHKLFHDMVHQDVNTVVMEVSSHALALERVYGLEFQSAVFTNLSRDHLDFHGTLEAYGAVKAQLFKQIASNGFGVVNLDDPAGQWMIDAANRRVVTYGEDDGLSDYRIENIEVNPTETSFILMKDEKKIEFTTRLQGHFNVFNCTAAAIVGLELGLDHENIQTGLWAVENVRGRMESILASPGYQIIIDYAHTPGALNNVLHAARKFTENRLIVVFGCGGDRDRGKRPQMGQIAADLGDLVFVTSDNPRREDPEAIIADVIEGLDSDHDVTVITDRKEAIHSALEAAKPGDVVMIAGKGHETYQEIGTERLPFDDREVVETYLAEQENR